MTKLLDLLLAALLIAAVILHLRGRNELRNRTETAPGAEPRKTSDQLALSVVLLRIVATLIVLRALIVLLHR